MLIYSIKLYVYTYNIMIFKIRNFILEIEKINIRSLNCTLQFPKFHYFICLYVQY